MDHTLRPFAPDTNREEIEPKPAPPRNQAFKGEMKRLIVDAPKQAKGEPLDSREPTRPDGASQAPQQQPAPAGTVNGEPTSNATSLALGLPDHAADMAAVDRDMTVRAAGCLIAFHGLAQLVGLDDNPLCAARSDRDRAARRFMPCASPASIGSVKVGAFAA